jgi:hypothetical protein
MILETGEFMGQVTIEGIVFDYELLENQQNLPSCKGIYIILCVKSNGNYVVVDVGMTYEQGIKDRISNHDRRDCWDSNCHYGLYVAYKCMDNHSKKEIQDLEKSLRENLKPLCGEI